jgi:heme/copper-type cytochrome/quinol oxidase subunit 2
MSGGILLGVHFLAIALIASSSRFDKQSDQISSILTVIPVTIVYVLAFIHYVVANAAAQINVINDNEAPFNRLATGVMFAVIAMFCAGLLFIVIRFAIWNYYTIEELKMWLSVVETGFGALIGLVFERLFGLKIEKEPIPPNPS